MRAHRGTDLGETFGDSFFDCMVDGLVVVASSRYNTLDTTSIPVSDGAKTTTFSQLAPLH
jgi:hypothetical protein